MYYVKDLTCPIRLILAFGKKGNHMVGYEENVLGEKKRRRKSRKGSIQRRKSSLVEMPDVIFDRNGSDDIEMGHFITICDQNGS